MVSFAQFLRNAGIRMSPALFVGIIAGGLFFVLVLVLTVVYVHARNKRKIKEGLFDGPSAVALAQHRPPQPAYSYATGAPPQQRTSRDTDKEELVVREVRQQEETYQQLMRDLARTPPATPSLPDQAPRTVPQRLVAEPTLLAPPPVAQLARGPSIRSHADSESIYSVASAPPDPLERQTSFQPFAATLPTVPASPSWPSSPGGGGSTGGAYVWPKRQLIRTELAPETYAKVRWRTPAPDDAAAPPTPVAQAMPTGVPAALRIAVPPPRPRRGTGPELPVDSPESARTVDSAHVYYAASAATTVPRTQRPY